MCDKEIWRPVVGFEGLYEVSNFGAVRSVDRIIQHTNKRFGPMTRKLKGRLLKMIFDGRGLYYQVSLSNGINKRYLVHRLVAEAFVENPLNLPEVNHKDENKTNNKASNLEWCDHKYNSNYGSRLSLGQGEKNPMSILTADKVKQIRNEFIPHDKDYGVTGLSKKYGISISHISSILHRRRWGWLD